jgi:ectoine hydroxylase-related dioxygenase (phytanoyl-CoA dioxygenase family)
MFRAEIDLICEGFDDVFSREQPQFLNPDNEYHHARDGRTGDELRSIIPTFIQKSDKLAWLRDDPRVTGIARDLLGPGYVYAESDGNIMSCDVYWHLDAYGAFAEHDHIKLFFYLETLRRDAGALRMIPGSQFANGAYAKTLRQGLVRDPSRAPDLYGVPLEEIPSWTLEVDPGDVIVGNFRTLHASFNGNPGRRLFTMNFGARRDATVDA